MARIIVLMGPQGAGKGTQAQMLARRLRIPVVATGEILREVARLDTPLGHQVKEAQALGQLVSDWVLAEIVSERLSREDCARGCLLDGFPRTLPQARLLDNIAVNRNLEVLVINIDVPRGQLWKRLAGRRTCSSCGTIYNVYFRPSKQDGVCDLDGQPLYARTDDNDEAIARRLAAYDEMTGPVLGHYRGQSKLHDIDGAAAPAEVYQSLENVVSSFAV